MPRRLNVALIGSKFMGRTHSNAYLKAPMHFNLPIDPVMHTIAARDKADLAQFAPRWGWRNHTTRWRDVIGDEIGERLDEAFITPIDREDIHELARRMDDVVDRIQETAEAMQIYDVEAPTQEAQRLAEILEAQAVELGAALGKLESMQGLGGHLKRVHELENEADGLSRAAIGRLFRESLYPLDVIKWRDIYQSLEESIDAAEDVSEILQRVVHKGT